MSGRNVAIRGLPLRRRSAISGDSIFRAVTAIVTGAAVLLICLMVYQSVLATLPIINRFGIVGFVTGLRWSPSFAIYGAFPFIYGNLLTSVIALLIAVPIALGVALLVPELLPYRVAGPVAVAVDLLAAVPSVVWGLWGLLVLVPFLRPVERLI